MINEVHIDRAIVCVTVIQNNPFIDNIIVVNHHRYKMNLVQIATFLDLNFVLTFLKIIHIYFVKLSYTLLANLLQFNADGNDDCISERFFVI